MRDMNGRFYTEAIVPEDTYGNLTIISFDHKDKNGQYYVKCRCIGNIRRSKTFGYFEDALCQRKLWEKELFGEWVREVWVAEP